MRLHEADVNAFWHGVISINTPIRKLDLKCLRLRIETDRAYRLRLNGLALDLSVNDTGLRFHVDSTLIRPAPLIHILVLLSENCSTEFLIPRAPRSLSLRAGGLRLVKRALSRCNEG